MPVRVLRPVSMTLVLGLALAVYAVPRKVQREPRRPAGSFTSQGRDFLLNGKPFQIRSGEMHYARVPREYWRDRMRKMKAMGLNTLCTYVFWNLHEPKPGQFDFSGNLDVAAFVRTAQEEGLYVIVRPGPYVCAEWEFGGFPGWLLATRDMKVRTTDPRFLKAAAEYMTRVGRHLAPLQISHGGPIILVQIENEYGSFGTDKVYLNAIREMIRKAGFDGALYTSDGDPDKLANGTLPDVLSVINFGDNPEKKFATFDLFRHNVPRMCGEYWAGWFDAWGEKHHTVPIKKVAGDLEWMLSRGISVNLYMFHGGSTTDFMNGANEYAAYAPDISSYDYDSPLDEAGRPTEKYFALREVITKYLPPETQLPALPAPLPIIELPRIELNESAGLADLLLHPILAERPQTMESLGQEYGFVLYRKHIDQPAKGILDIAGVHDYAVVYQGQNRLGVLDRRHKQHALEVDLSPAKPLDILVENLGRINFGLKMLDDRKGITEKVVFNGKEWTGWRTFALPMTDLSSLKFSRDLKKGPAFYRGTFELKSTGDTFLDMRDWGKGFVVVNDHNLGRYWRIGPQQSLFLPATLLKKGQNQIVIFDLEDSHPRSVEGRKNAIFETRTE